MASLPDFRKLKEVSSSDDVVALVQSNDQYKTEQKASLGTTAELGALNGATAGTVVASKAVIVDASKDIGDFGDLDATNFDAGLSGTAGTVDIFPTTAAKGKIALTAADSAGDTTTTVVNASQSGARTYTIPDGGASASFMLTQGAQTIVGAQTFSAAPIFSVGPALGFLTGANNGTAGTNCTAVEYGDGYNHVTVITMTAAEFTPTIPADAEGAGAIIYTFPAGAYMGYACHMDVTAGVMDSATNACDLGIGSLISSGDITTNSTAAMEDWCDSQTVANVSTFVKEKAAVMTAGPPLLFEAAGSHVLHINIAGTWNSTVSTASVTGTVTINWTFLGA